MPCLYEERARAGIDAFAQFARRRTQGHTAQKREFAICHENNLKYMIRQISLASKLLQPGYMEGVLKNNAINQINLPRPKLFYFVCHLRIQFLSKRFLKTASEGSKTAFFWCNISINCIVLQVRVGKAHINSVLRSLFPVRSPLPRPHGGEFETLQQDGLLTRFRGHTIIMTPTSYLCRKATDTE
jgi:hypothetical protein